MSVSALVPAYNEEKFIQATVNALYLIPEVSEVIVVDDGSTDHTAELAYRAGAIVSRLPQNRGKGDAINHGLAFVKEDIILLADGDLGLSAGELRALILPIIRGEADMTVAAPIAHKGVKGAGFGFVVKLARWGIKKFTGWETSYPLSGQRALRKEVLVGKCLPGFGVEVGLTIDALRKDYRISEVPVTISHRVTGWDLRGIAHRGKEFAHVIRALWLERNRI